jgi:hypothetical protein
VIPVLGCCTMTRPDQLARLLESIDHPVEHLVVVDNSARRLKISEAWVMDRIAPANQVRHLWYLRFPSNLGVPVSWNLIVKSTPLAPWWLIVNADAWFEPGSLARFAAEAGPDKLLFGGGQPPWCCFALGEQAVLKAGLLDEAFYPLYFEDNDWERRIRLAGVPVEQSDIPVGHDNSSTIGAGYAEQNSATFAVNGDYYTYKWGGPVGHETEDRPRFHLGWSLERRRQNHWEYR